MTVDAQAAQETLLGLLRSTGRYSTQICTPPEASGWDPINIVSSSTDESFNDRIGWTINQSAKRNSLSEQPVRSPTVSIPCLVGGKKPMSSCLEHCPYFQAFTHCNPHHRAEISPIEQDDINRLQDIWRKYRDDLTWPHFERKPIFSIEDFDTFHGVAQKVVDAMVEEYRVPMVLDQATISNTNHVGHPPHADNVKFDSVWWRGRRIRGEDEIVAANEGAFVLWRAEKTSHRSYSCSIALSDPNGYEGGEVHFFSRWGSEDPIARYKCKPGHGVAFCGCSRNIHAVTGVKSGFRLVLLIWTRPSEMRVPDSQPHICYFRLGTGRGVWLTTADIQHYQARKHRKDGKWWTPKNTDDERCQCEKCIAQRKDVLAALSTDAFSSRTLSLNNRRNLRYLNTEHTLMQFH